MFYGVLYTILLTYSATKSTIQHTHTHTPDTTACVHEPRKTFGSAETPALVGLSLVVWCVHTRTPREDPAIFVLPAGARAHQRSQTYSTLAGESIDPHVSLAHAVMMRARIEHQTSAR